MSVKQNVEKKVQAALKVCPTCGDCVGFADTQLKSKLCSKMEVLSYAAACNKFVPLEFGTSRMKVGAIRGISDMVEKLSPAEKRALGLLLYLDGNNRTGLQFMQKVVVRYHGSAGANYVSNFMYAYVMYASNDIVRVMSQNGKCVLTYTAATKDAVMDLATFEPLYQEMLAKNRLIDPDKTAFIARRFRAEEEYDLGLVDKKGHEDLTTIDTVFKENNVRAGRATTLSKLVDESEFVTADPVEGVDYHKEKDSECMEF